MPWGSVYVRGSEGEDVYINGNYEQAAGPTNNMYTVEYGLNTFETLDDDGKIVLRAETTVDDDRPVAEVELQPVTADQSGGEP